MSNALNRCWGKPDQSLMPPERTTSLAQHRRSRSMDLTDVHKRIKIERRNGTFTKKDISRPFNYRHVTHADPDHYDQLERIITSANALSKLNQHPPNASRGRAEDSKSLSPARKAPFNCAVPSLYPKLPPVSPTSDFAPGSPTFNYLLGSAPTLPSKQNQCTRQSPFQYPTNQYQCPGTNPFLPPNSATKSPPPIPFKPTTPKLYPVLPPISPTELPSCLSISPPISPTTLIFSSTVEATVEDEYAKVAKSKSSKDAGQTATKSDKYTNTDLAGSSKNNTSKESDLNIGNLENMSREELIKIAGLFASKFLEQKSTQSDQDRNRTKANNNQKLEEATNQEKKVVVNQNLNPFINHNPKNTTVQTPKPSQNPTPSLNPFINHNLKKVTKQEPTLLTNQNQPKPSQHLPGSADVQHLKPSTIKTLTKATTVQNPKPILSTQHIQPKLSQTQPKPSTNNSSRVSTNQEPQFLSNQLLKQRPKPAPRVKSPLRALPNGPTTVPAKQPANVPTKAATKMPKQVSDAVEMFEKLSTQAK